MVIAVQAPDIIARARRSDKKFDEMMRGVDRFGGNVHVIETLQRGVETAYNSGYLAGYQAAQGSVRDAIGIPDSD